MARFLNRIFTRRPNSQTSLMDCRVSASREDGLAAANAPTASRASVLAVAIAATVEAAVFVTAVDVGTAFFSS